MGNVGTAAAGKTLIGAGLNASPTYVFIGTNSGLAAHGVLLAEGNNAFTVASPGASGAVLASNGATNDPSFQTIGSLGGIISITGDSGGAESPSAGNFNILGSGSITVVGSANTETVQLTGLTNHTVLVGAGSSTITKVGPGSSGQVFQSGGASADPAYSTATFPSTATSTGTILRADGTNWVASTATYPNTAGTSGNVLTSNGTNWTSAAVTAPGGLNVATFSFTSAQVKALRATPQQVIATPGSGKAIIVVNAISKMTYGGTNAFTNGQNLVLIYTGSGGQSTNVTNLMSSGVLDATATGYGQSTSNFTLISATPATVENQALFFFNSGASEVTGNAAGDNTVSGAILYYVISI